VRRYGFVRPGLRALFTTVDAVGDAMRGIVPRRAPGEPRRILLVNLTHIGDLLLTTPAIAALRERYPAAHLTMLVGPWSREVVEGNPRLDAVSVYRASWWDRERGTSYFKPGEFGELVRQIRSGSFDAVINFKSFFQENLAAALAGVPIRIGYGIYGGGFLHTHEVPFPWNSHTASEHLHLTAALGASAAPRPTEIHPAPEDHAWAREALASFSGEWVAIHPGAGIPARRWPLERFRALAEELYARRGAQVAWVGGDDDRERVAEIQKTLRAPSLSFAGTGAIRRTAALIARCAGFVGNDSGPGHLAAATGVPTLVIFSGTNDMERWKPWGADVHTLQPLPEGAPSGLADGIRDEPASMSWISVGQVATQLMTMLDRSRSGRVDAPASGP